MPRKPGGDAPPGPAEQMNGERRRSELFDLTQFDPAAMGEMRQVFAMSAAAPKSGAFTMKKPPTYSRVSA